MNTQQPHRNVLYLFVDLTLYYFSQMLRDNLELQEAIVSAVKAKSRHIIKLVPPDDQNTISKRLQELDLEFLRVRDRLFDRKQELVKNSIEWQDFNNGLKSTSDWLSYKEQFIDEMCQANSETLDIVKFKVCIFTQTLALFLGIFSLFDIRTIVFFLTEFGKIFT